MCSVILSSSENHLEVALSTVSEISVSVILPVYNVGPWIGKCIESLKKQTLQNLEFIFVDDLGSDDSMKQVEAWAAEDNRVRIIRNQKNIGSGRSRNRGIEEARGEYLSFVDPDDRVADDFYELLYVKAKETSADIVKGIRVPIDEDESAPLPNVNPKELNRLIRETLRRGTPLYSVFTHEHQSAIYKRSFLKEHESVRYGTSANAQDTTFLLRLCLETKSIAFENDAEYYYLQRSGAATGSYTLKRAWGELDSLREKIDTILDYPIDKYTYISFAGKIQGYTNNYYLATIAEDFTQEDKASYIAAVKEQMSRFPDEKKLIKENVCLAAIKSYNEILPSRKVQGVMSYRDCFHAWVEFISEHPNADISFNKACADLIAKAIGSEVLALFRTRTEKRCDQKNVHAKLSKLRPKRRFQILFFTPIYLLIDTCTYVKYRIKTH